MRNLSGMPVGLQVDLTLITVCPMDLAGSLLLLNSPSSELGWGNLGRSIFLGLGRTDWWGELKIRGPCPVRGEGCPGVLISGLLVAKGFVNLFG